MTVKLMAHMGDDLMVVNAARVSMGKFKTEFDHTDVGLISYLARENHFCYDDQTDILTESGWVRFSELSPTQKVAQVFGWEGNDFRMEFVLPQEIHSSHYTGPMYLCESETINYCVTPKHKMLFKRRLKNGHSDWTTGNSDENLGREKVMQTTASLVKEGIGTFDEGAYLGFILGDGFRVNNIRVNVRLKKPRKIAYLTDLLGKLGFEYKCEFTDDGVTEFHIYDDFSDVGKATTKKLPDLVDKSKDYIQGLFDGLVNSDGTVKNSGWEFSSSSQQLQEGFSLLATLCGYSLGEVRAQHFDNPNHNINRRVTVLTRHTGHVNNNRREDEKTVGYDGMVYCVTVPSGMVMVRRNGKQVVCGNTPLTHPQIQFYLQMPMFVANQWKRHRIGFTGQGDDIDDEFALNEESRRYVDDEPTFWVPEVLRSRAEKVKQGSGGPLPEELNSQLVEYMNMVNNFTKNAYQFLLDKGVCPEQARIVLSQSMEVQFFQTGSLSAWHRLCQLRTDLHAQKEIRDFAVQVAAAVEPLFPVSWAAMNGETEKLAAYKVQYKKDGVPLTQDTAILQKNWSAVGEAEITTGDIEIKGQDSHNNWQTFLTDQAHVDQKVMALSMMGYRNLMLTNLKEPERPLTLKVE